VTKSVNPSFPHFLLRMLQPWGYTLGKRASPTDKTVQNSTKPAGKGAERPLKPLKTRKPGNNTLRCKKAAFYLEDPPSSRIELGSHTPRPGPMEASLFVNNHRFGLFLTVLGGHPTYLRTPCQKCTLGHASRACTPCSCPGPATRLRRRTYKRAHTAGHTRVGGIPGWYIPPFSPVLGAKTGPFPSFFSRSGRLKQALFPPFPPFWEARMGLSPTFLPVLGGWNGPFSTFPPVLGGWRALFLTFLHCSGRLEGPLSLLSALFWETGRSSFSPNSETGVREAQLSTNSETGIGEAARPLCAEVSPKGV